MLRHLCCCSKKDKTMKIGILTYHSPVNFGANLQAYASSQYFESLGHEVKVINYIIGGKIPSYQEGSQAYAHWQFSQNVLKVTKPCFSGRDIYETVKEETFDLIVIGADAVWGKRNRERLKVFHCDWLWGTDLDGKVKVACMSPAFMGTNYHDLTAEERASFKNGLLHFFYVNTRDEWTKYVVNRDIMGEEYIKKTNPDPVFLLDSYVNVEWEHPDFIESKNYIVLSLKTDMTKGNPILVWLRKNWIKRLMGLAHSKGLKVVELPLPENISGLDFDYTVPYPINPLQWYLWIKNSSGFFGYRFHAIVSCLSSGIPFLSLDGYGTMPIWSRILNILGNHTYDHQVSNNSKIRNLLHNSSLEMNRFNATEVCFIAPKVILSKFSDSIIINVVKYGNLKKQEFDSNMREMIKIAKS